MMPKRRFANSFIDKDTFIALLIRTGNEKNLLRCTDVTEEDIERVRMQLRALRLINDE